MKIPAIMSEAGAGGGRSSATAPVRLRPFKVAVYSLLPVVMLILAAEMAVRFLASNRTVLATPGLGTFGRNDSIAQVDADLGWSMRPHLRPAGGGRCRPDRHEQSRSQIARSVPEARA